MAKSVPVRAVHEALKYTLVEPPPIPRRGRFGLSAVAQAVVDASGKKAIKIPCVDQDPERVAKSIQASLRRHKYKLIHTVIDVETKIVTIWMERQPPKAK